MKGRLHGLTRDIDGNLVVSFRVFDEKNARKELEQIKDENTIEIQAKKVHRKRSLSANALLWECLDKIAISLRADKWDVYLMMLRRYGKFTYICVKPHVVDAVKLQWRECEEIGEIEINGEKAVQLLCYFGSSTYNAKEFSRLLDGVISEMREMGLETPPDEGMRRAIEQWKKNGNK